MMSRQDDSYTRIWSGTPGLDEMLEGDADYWTQPEENLVDDRWPWKQTLIQGRTTLILGPSGTGKTFLCLQFLMGHADMDLVQKGEATPSEEISGQVKKAWSQTLYINFENEPKVVEDTFVKGSSSAGLSPKRWAEFFKSYQSLYRRRANLDVGVLMAEIRHIIRRFEVARVAIDGLSDLLATTEQKEYSRLVESLLESIQAAAKGPGRVTTFVTIEMEPSFDLFPPTQGLSMTADNIIVLRQLPINDELRKTAYILKARGHSHDAQVREVCVDVAPRKWLPPLRIQGGLEMFRNLLTGKPQPIQVVLQLFAENSAAERFNAVLESELKKLFGYDLKTYSFSRAEMNRTLEDAIAPSGRIPPSDVKVFSLDEWWIQEYAARRHSVGGNVGAAEAPSHPLLRLDTFCSSLVDERGGRHASPVSQADFWLVEIEKAHLVRSLDDKLVADLVAIPNYTDFGLFCVNSSVARRWGSNRFDWTTSLTSVPRLWARTGPRYKAKRGKIKGRTKCNDPWYSYSPPKAKGVTERQYETVVEQLIAARNRFVEFGTIYSADAAVGSEPPNRPSSRDAFVGFVFDSETVETTVCTFLEFCWSFGADENFLIRDALRYAAVKGETETLPAFLDRLPLTAALRFLQFLVVESLMPARPTLRMSKDSLLSRHWYSTLSETQSEPSRTDPDRPSGTGQTGADIDEQKTSDGIVALPFFPIGTREQLKDRIGTEAIRASLQDACARMIRLAERIRDVHGHPARRNSPKSDSTKSWDPETTIKTIEQAVASLESSKPENPLEVLTTQLTELRKSVLRGATLGPRDGQRTNSIAAKAMDYRDILEILRWQELRLQIIRAEIEGWSLKSAVDGECNQTRRKRPIDAPLISALTGYACSGSWLLGVHRTAHSPILSWKVIEEMTSLKSADLRASSGSGIPVRKDFYEFHGSEPVNYAEHLTWNELLKFTAAHGRRRERTLCRWIRMSEVFNIIDEQVKFCLVVADQRKTEAEYLSEEKGGDTCNPKREEARLAIAKVARTAAETILRHICQAMKTAKKTHETACYECSDKDQCKTFAKYQDGQQTKAGSKHAQR